MSGNIFDLILVSNTEDVGNLKVLSPLPHCKHSPVVVDFFMLVVLTNLRLCELRGFGVRGAMLECVRI